MAFTESYSAFKCARPSRVLIVKFKQKQHTKPGVYLPKTSDQWAVANGFFKSTFVNIDFYLDNTDVDAILRLLNNSIYNYFRENYGTVKANVDRELVIE